jgi:soluble lytic murein transglycosylase
VRSAAKQHKVSRHVSAIAILLTAAFLLALLYNFLFESVEEVAHPIKYHEYVKAYAEMYEIPEEIILAIIYCESSFDASAVSHAGAVGLMQLMPGTYKWLCSKTGDRYDALHLYNPEINIRYGTYLLSILYQRYEQWDVVFAAYNAGMGNVDDWLENPAYADEFGTLKYIPFKETRNFVSRVNQKREIYRRICEGLHESIAAETTAAP